MDSTSLAMINVTACTDRQGGWPWSIGKTTNSALSTSSKHITVSAACPRPDIPSAVLWGWSQVCQKRKAGQPTWSSTLLLLERMNSLRSPSRRPSGWGRGVIASSKSPRPTSLQLHTLTPRELTPTKISQFQDGKDLTSRKYVTALELVDLTLSLTPSTS